MAFTLSTFVKHTGGAALRAHMAFRDLDLADRIDPKADPSQVTKIFKSAWLNLAADDVQSIHQDFDRAEQFANEDAQAVLRSSCLRSETALDALERESNDRARALAILRLEPSLFEDAEIQLGVHKLLANRQLWAGFQLASNAAPRWSEDRRSAFEDAVRAVYRAKTGVSRRVRLEIDEREGVGLDGAPRPPVHQVTIFHEGDSNREAVFRHGDEVAIEERRPALMAALVFDPSTSTMEVASKGGRQVQHDIAKAFAATFWADSPELAKLKPASFAIQRLKAPMDLVFQPSDGLRSVCIAGMVLKARGAGRLDVTLRNPQSGQTSDLWVVAAEQFGANNPLHDPAMLVVAVDIRFEFQPGPSERKPKTRTVKLSLGNGSNKAKLSERHLRIVDECLRQSGLAAASPTAKSTVPTAEPVR